MDKNDKKPAVVKPYALNPTSEGVGKKNPAPIKTHLKKTRLSVGFLGFFLFFPPWPKRNIKEALNTSGGLHERSDPRVRARFTYIEVQSHISK